MSIQLTAGKPEFFEVEITDAFGNTKRLTKGFTLKSQDDSLATVELVRENVVKVMPHGPMESTPKFDFTYGAKTIEIEGLIDIGEVDTVKLIPVADPDATTPTA